MTTEIWREAIGGLTTCDAEQLAQLLPACALALNADVHTVDLRSAIDSAQALQIIGARLKFPEYYGQNLDALYDMTGECADILQGKLDIQVGAVPHIWLIQSAKTQEKMLFAILDVLRDAISSVKGTALSILWVVV